MDLTATIQMLDASKHASISAHEKAICDACQRSLDAMFQRKIKPLEMRAKWAGYWTGVYGEACNAYVEQFNNGRLFKCQGQGWEEWVAAVDVKADLKNFLDVETKFTLCEYTDLETWKRIKEFWAARIAPGRRWLRKLNADEQEEHRTWWAKENAANGWNWAY